MPSTWTITTADERFTLEDRQGRTTITVTNISSVDDRAMLEIVTEPAIAGWFTVAEPQRTVPAGASTPYPVKVTVPADAPAGEYAVQAMVYSADAAPEETSVSSGRILLTVTAAATPRPRFKLWWLAIPAALVVAAAVTVVAIIATRSDPATPEPVASTTTTGQPSATPTQSPTVLVPDLTGLSEPAAIATLEQTGLVASVKYRHDPANAGHVTQSVPAGTEVARGAPIELVFSIALTVPDVTATVVPLPPDGVEDLSWLRGLAPMRLDLTWSQAEAHVTTWHVRVTRRLVYQSSNLNPDPSRSILGFHDFVPATSFSHVYFWTPLDSDDEGLFVLPSGLWSVAAVDDFGTIGPYTLWTTYPA